MGTRSQYGGGRNGRGGAGRFQPVRGGHKPKNQNSAPDVAAVPTVAAVPAADQGEWRTCRYCNVKGHVEASCPQLAPEVRKYLQRRAERMKARGGGGMFVSEADVPVVAPFQASMIAFRRCLTLI